MALGYIIREGFSGFKRAKISMVGAIFTITVSLLLLSSFTILLINANTVVETLREKVEMEAFLDDQVSLDDVNRIRTQIAEIEGVRESRFISKDEAAAIFKEEFGEDIYKVLSFNPLPASFKISLQEGYRTAVGAEQVFTQIKALKGVNDVIYRKRLLEMLDQQAVTFLWIAFGVGGFLMLSSIVLVGNTIRLAIYAKRKIIQTMKLIGATRSFVRTPFLLEGLIQGLLGGLLAAGIIFALFQYLETLLSVQMSDFAHVEPYYYGIVVGFGCLLGLIGSIVSIRRFIGESVVS